eukprot:12913313-Prorocentrum_lima.AAC.1
MEKDLDMHGRKLTQVTQIMEKASASQRSGVLVVIPRFKMEPSEFEAKVKQLKAAAGPTSVSRWTRPQ